MISQEDNTREKGIFMNKYSSAFTQYLDVEKLGKKIPSFEQLNNELAKLVETTSDKSYHHTMSKKVLLNSKNAKQLCRDGFQ